ncbi:MAG: hypothetical protein PHX43_08795 [Alphaproteobacteria bacterium]|nr:hypothetical protein [Alphaproteobacteria bacterium]
MFSSSMLSRGGPSLDVSFMGGLPGSVTYSRASPAWYFNSSGSLAQAAANEPRFDYDPATLVMRGLLNEEQKTNLFRNNASPVTQSISVVAQAYTLSFYGTGSIVLSGAKEATVNGVGAFPARTTYTFTPTAGTLTLTVSGSLNYAQLEAGLFATSVIVTGDNAVARAADSVKITSIPWFNSVSGALSVEFIPPEGLIAGTYPWVACFNDGSTSNEIGCYLNGNTMRIATKVQAGGVTQMDLACSNPVNIVDVQKVAMRYAQNDFAGASNGSNLVTDVSGTVPVVTKLNLGRERDEAAPMSCWLRRFRYWNCALDNVVLQRVTQ